MNDFKGQTSITSWGNGLLTENLNPKVGNKIFLIHVIISFSGLHLSLIQIRVDIHQFNQST